jgi:hypothetical protein
VTRAKAQSTPRTQMGKFEARNPKSETISNDPKRKHEIESTKLETNLKKNKTTTMLQTGRIEFTALDFLILNSFWPRFVSDFVLRISDFHSDRKMTYEAAYS